MPGVRAVPEVRMPKGRGLLEPCFPAFWQFAPAKPFRGLARPCCRSQAGHRGAGARLSAADPADSRGVANQHRSSPRNILPID